MTNQASLLTLEFDRVLTLVSLEAKSDPGRAAVAAMRPLPTLEACENAHADLAEMTRFYQTEGLLPLSGLIDAESVFDRETVLELEESWMVIRAVRAIQSVRDTLLRVDTFPRLHRRAEGLPDFGELLSKLNRYFTRDGKLREDASTELRSIRNRIHAKRSAIQKTLNDLMNRNAAAVQEPLIVQRGDRYCIPVRSDHRNAVPGILHERSGSGASFFIEPIAAVELNNDLADLLIQEREEIGRITRYISQLLFESGAEIRAAARETGALDALQACALFGDAIRGARPAFSEHRRLEIINGRHPLLDERLAEARQHAFGEEPSDRRVIPLSVRLGPLSDDESAPSASALVISGPNAGGKTVALKTAGLLVAMGMAGLPVPADDGTLLPCVDDLHVLIGDDQSVLEHLSTFSAYLVRLKKVVTRATPKSLVLLDELGSGTDPEEGSALAASVIEHLLDLGALIIVTTHLSALKSFAVNDLRIVNASMDFDSASGQPTYRMIAGIPGRSRAIEVARNIGLPDSIIESARGRLGERYAEADQLVATLQKKMVEIVSQEKELAEAERQVHQARKQTAELNAKLEAERLRLGSSYREELDRLRDDVSRQLSAEIKALRDMDRTSRANVSAPQVIRTVTTAVEKAIEFIPVEQREVHVGDRVEHRRFKVAGDVISVDASKAVIVVNGRKMTVDTADLVTKASGKATAPQRQRPVSRDAGDTPVISAELNLIGQRVDEALDEIDRFLDRALLEGREAVRLIHGFGTGKLRAGVRDHLRRHPAVKSWRPGDDDEGGDGATVAVLG